MTAINEQLDLCNRLTEIRSTIYQGASLGVPDLQGTLAKCSSYLERAIHGLKYDRDAAPVFGGITVKSGVKMVNAYLLAYSAGTPIGNGVLRGEIVDILDVAEECIIKDCAKKEGVRYADF